MNPQSNILNLGQEAVATATLGPSIFATLAMVVVILVLVYKLIRRLRADDTGWPNAGKGRFLLFATAMLTVVTFLLAALNCLDGASGDRSSDFSLVALLSILLVQLIPAYWPLRRDFWRAFHSSVDDGLGDGETKGNAAWIYAGFLFPSSFLCAAAWLAASCEIPVFYGVSIKWALGNIALFISILIVIGSVYILYRMMGHTADDPFDIGKALKGERFGALCFFFSVFLNLTFMLGFSLALHDSGYREIEPKKVALFSSQFYDPALDRPMAGSSDAPVEPKKDVRSDGVAGLINFSGQENPDHKVEPQVFIFFHGGTSLEGDLTDIEFVDEGSVCSIRPIPPRLEHGLKLSVFRGSWNTVERERLDDYLGKVARGRLTSFNVWSGTTLDQPLVPGLSNHSIAGARASRVCREIEEIGWGRNGERPGCRHSEIIPGLRPEPLARNELDRVEDFSKKCEFPIDYASLHDLLLKSTVSEATSEIDRLRLLQVSVGAIAEDIRAISLASTGLSTAVESVGRDVRDDLIKRLNIPRKLHLLDYMYFTIYTITTTGYGDIVPLSGFSKFICSFANIVEVFYLAMFFNIMIARID